MVLIISETSDRSTDYVVEYLRSYSCPFIRINEDCSGNLLYEASLNNNKATVKFTFNNTCIDYESISCIWFRRGYIQHSIIDKKAFTTGRNTIDTTSFMATEENALNDYVLYLLSQKPCLGWQNSYNANKLITLHIASEIGLNIADTEITSTPVNADHINTGWITKPIQDRIPIHFNHRKVSPRLLHITSGNAAFFSPKQKGYILLQKFIDVAFEIRTFFIGEQYFSVAIFPPANGAERQEQKEADRIVPYLLPDDIISKLKKLNRQLHFNTGSIDMILDTSGSFFFLEINPVGQLDFVSQASHYQIEQEIALYLFNYEQQSSSRNA